MKGLVVLLLSLLPVTAMAEEQLNALEATALIRESRILFETLDVEVSQIGAAAEVRRGLEVAVKMTDALLENKKQLEKELEVLKRREAERSGSASGSVGDSE
jgi:hypothetical protein